MATTIRGSDNFDTGVRGKVLQVVVVEDNTTMVLSSSTYTDTNMSASITPSSTSSKILCMWDVQADMNANGGGFGVRLLRDATNIYTSATQYDNYSGSAGDSRYRAPYKHLDSPNTTSPITYKVQVGTYLNRAANFNNDGNQTSLILMEIEA